MNGEYERLILGLEPWLRGLLRKTWEKVPKAYFLLKGSYSLKPLGNEGESEDEGLAADVRASLLEKAVSVARDIESGDRPPPDKPPEQYFKQVMRNALRDWIRTQLKTADLSSDQRAWLDNELYSISTDGEDEGGEGFSGWPTVHAPTGPRAAAWPQRPPLLTLTQQRFWWKAATPAETQRIQQLLEDIPNAQRREVVLLNLQGYRQKQIVAKVLKTQQRVSKALQEQYDAWGWSKRKVRRVQYVMARANLCRLIWRVFDKEGPNALYPPPGWEPSLAFDQGDFDEGELDEEESYERVRRVNLQPERQSFKLPEEEEAYRRSRPSGGEEEERDRNEWRKPGPQQGSRERRQRQDRLDRSKDQDSMLYQAIMSDPALASWTDGLELRHMPQLFAQMIDY